MKIFRLTYCSVYEIEADTLDEALDKIGDYYESDCWLEDVEEIEEEEN